jgi:hypothetical protein
LDILEGKKMSLELERQLIEMGVIPASPIAELSALLAPRGLCEEIGVVAVTRESYNQLPSYNEETQEYMF